MREEACIAGRIFTVTMLISVLLVSAIAYAAPPATQKAAPQVQPMQSGARMKYDPNAPPQGTITITASNKGNVNASIWFPETYQYIEWTCKGTSSNLVDVTLWRNESRYTDISKGISSGQTGYRVPKNMPVGTYELRITSQDDPRVEARKAVVVFSYEITITAPKGFEVLYLGDKYTVTWTYKGNPPPIEIRVCADTYSKSGIIEKVTEACFGASGQFSNITTGTGNGSAVWTLPTQFPGPNRRIHLKIPLPRPAQPIPPGMLPNFGSDSVYGVSSESFYIACKQPYTDCGYSCANLLNDVGNCGRCANKCGSNMICDQGKCK